MIRPTYSRCWIDMAHVARLVVLECFRFIRSAKFRHSVMRLKLKGGAKCLNSAYSRFLYIFWLLLAVYFFGLEGASELFTLAVWSFGEAVWALGASLEASLAFGSISLAVSVTWFIFHFFSDIANRKKFVF